MPVVIWIHGGGWFQGSKDANNPASGLVDRGIAVAAINYRLSPQAPFPAQIQDCKQAVRWIRSNAKKYQLDPDRIGVWGASAGGHLAALLGTTADLDEPKGKVVDLAKSTRVQAVCDWFGPTDLVTVLKEPPPGKKQEIYRMLSGLAGGPAERFFRRLESASPIKHVDGDEPPFLILHGDADPLVPVSQSRSFAEALKAKGVNVTLRIIPGAQHGFPDRPQCVQESISFFERTLNNHQASKPSGGLLGGVDLLAKIDVGRDQRSGIWHHGKESPAQLRGYAKLGENLFHLALPQEPIAAYRLRLRVRRVKNGTGVLGVGLGFGASRFNVLFDLESNGQYFTGVGGRIEGVPLPERADAYKGKLFQDGVTHQLVITVRENAVTVSFDEAALYSWKGDLGLLSRSTEQGGDPLQVGGGFPGDFQFEEIVFEPLPENAS